jgi:hypothetical protein
MNIVMGATIDSSRRQCFSPHPFIWQSVGANETHGMEFRCQRPKLAVIGKVEIENDNSCSAAVDDMPDLIEIASDTYISKIAMKLGSEMLSDDAVGLSDYDVMVNHGSLTYKRPNGRLTSHPKTRCARLNR